MQIVVRSSVECRAFVYPIVGVGVDVCIYVWSLRSTQQATTQPQQYTQHTHIHTHIHTSKLQAENIESAAEHAANRLLRANAYETWIHIILT